MSSALITDLLAVLDQLSGGVHPGFRPAHAKWLMCAGTFHPSRQAAELSGQAHSTTVRFASGALGTTQGAEIALSSTGLTVANSMSLGVRALLVGFLVTLLNASIAGLLE